MKQLEKHPAFKSLTLKIDLDKKMVGILASLSDAKEAMKDIFVQAELAASGMQQLGEAARTAAATAYAEWNALGEQLLRIQSLASEAGARSEKAVSSEAASGGLSGALSDGITFMAAIVTIATFNKDILGPLKKELIFIGSEFMRLAAIQGVLRAGTLALSYSFVMLGKALWPVALISGVIWGLSELYKAFSGTNEKTKEAERINLDHINSLKQQRDELRQLAGEYETLQAAQEAGYATIEQKQKLLSLQTQLVESYGVSASAISAEGDTFGTTGALIQMRIDALNEEIAAQHELDKLKLKAKDNERTDTIQNTEGSILKDEAKIKKLQMGADKYQELAENTKGFDSIRFSIASQGMLDDIAELAQGIETKRGNLKTALSETTDVLRTELDTYMSAIETDGGRVSDTQRAFMEGMLDSIARNGKDIDSQVADMKSAFGRLRGMGLDWLLADFNEAKKAKDIEGMEKVRASALRMMDDFNHFTPVTDSFRESFLAMFDTTAKKASMSSDEVEQFVKNSIKELTSLEDSYQKLSRGEKLSSDTVTDLIAQYPKLSQYLAETNDFTFQKGELIKQVMEDQRQQRIEELEASIESTKAKRDELENKRKMHEQYFSAIIKGFSAVLGIKFNVDKDRVLSPEEQKEKEELDRLIAEKEASLALLKQPININGTTGTSKGSSTSKEKYEPNLNFSKAQLEVENYNRLLEKNNDEIQLAIAQGGLYDKRLANRISLYSDLAKSLNTLGKEQEKERGGLRTKLTKTGLVDSAGEVVADVEKRLLALSKGKAAARLGYSAEELEQFVERYLELAGEIADTASQLRAATNDLADALQIGLDKITAASTRKQDKANHKIALLGEINTEEEKKLLAQYSAEIVNALAQESREIDDKIAEANAVIQNKDSSKQEKEAYRVLLENLKQSKKQADESLIQESEQYGKSLAEALAFGYDKTLEELKYEKSLLGSIDSEEEKKKAAELDQQIYDTLTKGIDRYNQDIVELERKLSTELTDEERHRAQAKLEVLREYVKNYTLEQAQAVSAWENSVKSSAKDAMSALEDFYAKQGKEAQKLLDDQLEDYRRFIEERKKLFKREDEKVDFNDNRSKLQKEEAELRKQIAVLSLDNSIEGQYKREQLEQELADKLEEIRKLELDRSRSLREQDYDDLLRNKEDEIKTAKEAADTKWQQDLAADQHYSALKQAMLENNTAKMQDAMLNFSNNVQVYMDAIGASIDRNLVEKLEDTQRFQNLANTIMGIPNLNVPTPPPTSPNSSSRAEATKTARDLDWDKYLENKEKAEKLKNSDPVWQSLNTLNNKLREEWKFPDGSYSQLKDLKFFHEGGEVGVEGTTTVKWWQGMLKSDEVLSVLRKGEAVIKKPGAFVQQMVASVAQRMNAGPSFALSEAGTSGPITNHYEYDIRIERLEGGEAGAKALFKHIKTQSQRGNRI
ncbi:hypothetical protein ACFQMJ_25540 [Cohnella cellulosilytica]|uniref:Uncharacterized protein n=2 Tax=Cohnella cellulosilytica TaxID=986710 RepID=A0ABW2FFF3_9BACL